MKTMPPMNNWVWKNQKCSQVALFSCENMRYVMKICFFENFHTWPYLVGFPNVVIMVQCSVPHHVLIVSALSFIDLFNLGSAYCASAESEHVQNEPKSIYTPPLSCRVHPLYLLEKKKLGVNKPQKLIILSF